MDGKTGEKGEGSREEAQKSIIEAAVGSRGNIFDITSQK